MLTPSRQHRSNIKPIFIILQVIGSNILCHQWMEANPKSSNMSQEQCFNIEMYIFTSSCFFQTYLTKYKLGFKYFSETEFNIALFTFYILHFAHFNWFCRCLDTLFSKTKQKTIEVKHSVSSCFSLAGTPSLGPVSAESTVETQQTG